MIGECTHPNTNREDSISPRYLRAFLFLHFGGYFLNKGLTNKKHKAIQKSSQTIDTKKMIYVVQLEAYGQKWREIHNDQQQFHYDRKIKITMNNAAA